MTKNSNGFVVIDIETTGLDKKKDHIIQLSCIKIDSDGKETGFFDKYILPKGDFEISPEAFEKHKISKEFLMEHGVSLESIFDEFVEFVGDNIVVTYNGISFDIPFIMTEFLNIGLDPKLMDRKMLDVFLVEKAVNSHTLEETYKRYTGNTSECAHNSLCDVRMTYEVLKGQINNAKDKDLHAVIVENAIPTRINFIEDIIRYDDNANIIFNNGKYRGCKVVDICNSDPSYIKWLFKDVLCERSKQIVMDEYKSKMTNKN